MLRLSKREIVVNLGLFIVLIFSILTIVFPYQVQHYFFDKVSSILNFRKESIRIITTDSMVEQSVYKTLINTLGENSIDTKIIYAEKEPPHQMLVRNKGDLAIVPGFVSLMNSKEIAPITMTIPSHLIVLSPKNYGILEFSQLTGKKVGIKDGDKTGALLFQELMKIYLFDIPPILIDEPIKDIEKSFRDGIVECVIWIENLFSPEVQKLIKSGDYNIVDISLSNILIRILPGLSFQTIDLAQISENKLNIVEIDSILVARKNIPSKTLRKIIKLVSIPEVYASISYKDPFNFLPNYLTPHPELKKFLTSGQISSIQLKTLMISFSAILILALSIRYLLIKWRTKKARESDEELEKMVYELKKIENNLTVNTPLEEQLKYLKVVKSLLSLGIQYYNHNKINVFQFSALLHKITQIILSFTEKSIEYNLKKTYLEKLDNKPITPSFTTSKAKSEPIQENVPEPAQLLLFDTHSTENSSNILSSENQKRGDLI